MKRLDLQRHFHPRPSRARRALLLALAAAVVAPSAHELATALPFARVTEASAGGALAAGDTRERRRDIKRRLRQAEPFTYIDEILVARDSSLTRWRERTRRPLSTSTTGATRSHWPTSCGPATRPARATGSRSSTASWPPTRRTS